MGFGEQIVRIARLDSEVYAEVARDEAATGAALVVLLGACALEAVGGACSVESFLLGLAGNATRTVLWIVGIHLGARTLGLADALAPLVRALGFAAAPLALGFLTGLPLLGGLILLAKWALTFVGFTLASGRVLDAGGMTPALLVAVALGVALSIQGMIF